MSSQALQQIISDLQRRVADIESEMKKRRTGWKRIAGAASHDNHFAEAMRLGAKWRKQANRENW